MQRVIIGALLWGFCCADTGRHMTRRIRRRAWRDPLARQVQDQNRLDIVIYEEDYLTRALLQEWLSQEGYRARAGRPHDASLDRPADLVIVNVYMPKHLGAQWVRDIQEVHPNTPIIAISGQFRSGLCAAGATAQALGVQQVIAKPLIRADLLDAVRGMIGAPH